MWVVLVVAVALLLGSFAWSVWRDRMLCPVCEHAMSDHEREVKKDGTTGRSHCRICVKDCA